jgi:hypothetical protein
MVAMLHLDDSRDVARKPRVVPPTIHVEARPA